MISDPVAIFLVLAVVVYIAVRLEEKYDLFRSLGAAFVSILLAMVFSNTGLLPGESPTYDFLSGRGVSLGIALILLSVNVRSILQAGPRMLAAFAVGAVGSSFGSMIAALSLFSLVGPETWKLAGQFTGTYIGGGVNFAALGQALGTSSNMFTAAVATDVIVTALWMAACLTVPALFAKTGPTQEADATSPNPDSKEKPFSLERALHNSGKPLAMSSMAALIAIGVGAVWISGQLAARVPLVPPVLWLTTIVLILAQIPAIKSLTGSALMGNYLVLLFLAANGAQSVIANIFRVGPAVFYFAAITVAIHGMVIFGIGRLLRLDMPTLAVASQANVGGPASAMALAGARGYADRLLPGVAVGLMGYAIGNYCGLAVAAIVRNLLSG